MIQRIFLVAIAAGIAAGIFVTLVQQWKVIPLINQAELYEFSDGITIHSHKLSDLEQAILAEENKNTTQANTETTQANTETTENDQESWPQDGIERTLYTLGANIVTGVGFALLLCAAITMRGKKIDVKSGVLWGLAGFITFAFAPAIGLAPEVPGTEAAWLDERQNWFYLTAVATAIGLGLIIFKKQYMIKAVGVILIALPHIIGAPHPDEYAGSAPAPLAAEFAIHSLFASLCFWIILGAIAGYYFYKLDKNPTYS